MADELRTLPHSGEAERGVIGSILLDTQFEESTRVLDLCQARGITRESFYDPRNRLVFQTFLEMSSASVPLDSLSLLDFLRQKNRLDTVGGAGVIQSYMDDLSTSAHAEYFIGILRKNQLLRMLIERARDTETKCFDPTQNEDADVLLGEVEKSFLEIGGSQSVRKDWRVAVDDMFKKLDAQFDAPTLEGLPTGFKHLDDKLMGLKGGDMIVIAARPSVGKTSLAMNIAECVSLGQDINGNKMKGKAAGPHPVLIFSLEMSTESLARRMLAGRAGVNVWRLQRGLVQDSERLKQSARLMAAASVLRSAQLFIDDTSGIDVADMRARARRMKRTQKIELIVIDYLQLANCREFSRQGRQLETSRISGQIKAMAKELNVPVIVLSQLSRANEKDGDGEEVPKLSHLRDSGAIEQDADMVFLLRRPCKIKKAQYHDDETLAIIDVAKNRNGETGEVDLNFFQEGTRFGDREQHKRGAKAQQEIAQKANLAISTPADPPEEGGSEESRPESLTDSIEI